MTDSSVAFDVRETHSPADRPTTATAALAVLGVVYGDLGASLLYTYQAIVGAVGGQSSAADAIGLLSLAAWALIYGGGIITPAISC